MQKNNPLENKNQVQIKKSFWKRLVFWKYLVLTICLLVGSIGAYKWIREKYFSNSETPNPKLPKRKRTRKTPNLETERESDSEENNSENERLETEPERTLREANQTFQRIISDIRNDRISGETITVSLRSERERVSSESDQFLYCAVRGCAFTTGKQKQFCLAKHECSIPRCENLVIVYAPNSVTNFCEEHS